MPEIIVGVDATERGADALAFARRLSAVTGARLALAAVYPYEELLGVAAYGGGDRLRDGAVAMLERERASLDGAEIATCPVAVVPLGYPEREEAPIRTIGVGYDASEESQRALNEASDAARRLDADLRIIHVFDVGRRDAMTQGTSALRASVGDRLVIRGHHVGEHERDGEIVEVLGDAGAPAYIVRWTDTGHVSRMYPGSDAFVEHREQAP